MNKIINLVADNDQDELWMQDARKMRRGKTVSTKGGPGSGNFDHQGRPGKVGGSASGSSKPVAKPEGEVSESRNRVGSIAEYRRETPKFNRSKWEKKDFGTRMSEWDGMSAAQRDAMARADVSIQSDIEGRLSFAGKHPEYDGDVSGAIEKRVKQMGDFIPSESAKTISNTVSELDGVLEGLEVDGAKRHALAMQCVDALVAQENETLKRTLGDHGVAHIVGNINMAKEVLSTVPGADAPEDIAGIYIGSIFHDTGYLTEPGKVLGMDKDHPRWSTEHYDNNVRSLVGGMLGNRVAGTISNSIRNHAGTEINWDDDPSGSSLRLADNLGLFQDQKLPAMFRYVPQNVGVLENLYAGKISESDARLQITTNIKASNLSDSVKSSLNEGVKEVSKITGKFTLGMLGGRVKGFSWVTSKKGNHLRISFAKNSEATRLQKMFDLGQSQFRKFAKPYDIDPDEFIRTLTGEFTDSRTGNTVFEAIIVGEKELKKLQDLVLKHMGGQ